MRPLRVTVVRATDLQARGPGAVDSYVVLRHPSFGELRTDVVRGSAAPEYDEPFLCGMTPEQMEVPIDARVLAPSDAAEDDVLGTASIDVRALSGAAQMDPAITLARPGAAHTGTLSISIVDRGHPATLEARAGAPLDEDEAWSARVEGEIEARGFVAAWRKHLPEIVYVHATGADGGALVGAQLYRWMKKDPELAAHFDALPIDEKVELDASLIPGVGRVIEEIEELRPGEALDELREALGRVVGHDEILEGDGTRMECIPRARFQNWGRTVDNRPALTCLPKTKQGVMNLVKWATKHGKKVRMSGYRHTWESLYGADDEVLVAFLPLRVVEHLPAEHPPMDPSNQMQGIAIVGHVTEGGVQKALCKIGAGTTNEQFRAWCIAKGVKESEWTVPLNVIMVEITWGGSNAPICHGAGLRHTTLSDLVTEVELVNAKGELQTIKDPAQLKAVAGCFGLLGLVTAITLKLDPMTFAKLQPKAPRVALTIPPPGGKAPPGVDMTGVTEDAMKNAWDEFVHHCEHDYYAEWFWFPYESRCWVNCWNDDGKREEAVDYPSPREAWWQGVQNYLGELANQTLFRILPARTQARLMAVTAMLTLPKDTTIVTPVIDALHFRRGIQNMRVLDMELEIPIPPRADDATKPDWTVCQKAWWAVIDSIYTRHHTLFDAPMRIALEMRVMGASQITMAPQHGNSLGTCSIEVLTNLRTSSKEWLAFRQEITDAWTSYKDPGGAPLNVRPHWAKQWTGITLHGKPVKDYLKDVAYKDRIPEFWAGLAAAAVAGGYTLADARARFSNKLLDDVLGTIFR
jgi:hypothetical protein